MAGSPSGGGLQDSDGETHQVGVDGQFKPELNRPGLTNYNTAAMYDLQYYKIKLQVAPHSFTNLNAVPINAAGNVILAPPSFQRVPGALALPPSTIWGYNGQFPGPLINAEYGKPCLIHFANELHVNPFNLDSQNFGAPDRAFLTHLHNAHTAPESDGNPHHKPCPYGPGQWVENLYLNWPAGGDDREKQSFFWYHDHRMDHTGANVYKGLMGLYPIYDPVKDNGNEQIGLRLPGIRTENGDGTFDVKYDIPLALYDCRLDDGVTPHQDFHTDCGQIHPEWWGKTFYKHFPNNGFVGDIFTVNGVAYPVLHVKRRKYRFRLLDSSVARQYELKIMQGNVAAVPGQQGQYNFVDGRGRKTLGEQVMQFTQIASDGGLLPFPIIRNSIGLWPAKRREVIIDFSRFQDGSPTTNGEVLYITNIAQMLDGRKRTDRTTPVLTRTTECRSSSSSSMATLKSRIRVSCQPRTSRCASYHRCQTLPDCLTGRFGLIKTAWVENYCGPLMTDHSTPLKTWPTRNLANPNSGPLSTKEVAGPTRSIFTRRSIGLFHGTGILHQLQETQTMCHAKMSSRWKAANP